MPTTQDLKMKIPNVLVLLTSCLILSANVTADFYSGYVAYETGDYETALREFKSSRDPMSHTILGMMYDEGLGVLQDYKEAVKWYTKAAEQGDADAQGSLGSMYSSGHGVLQDNVYAHMWFNIASSNGNENARDSRDLAAEIMTPDQLAEAQRLARECVKKDYKNC